MTAILDARRPVGRLAAVRALALLAGLGVPAALAQTPAPAPAPAPAPKQAPKAAPKQQVPAPQQPIPAPQQPVQAPPPAATPMPQIVYSPWTKFCQKVPAGDPTPQTCLTLREGRLEANGQLVAAIALIERAGEQKKLLRITLPLGMQLNPGTRLTLDSEQPVSSGYSVCMPAGCLSDYEVTADFIGKLKKGQQLVVQGINVAGQVASFSIPLADFAKANDGAPTEPEVFEAAQKKFWEDKLKSAPPAAEPK